MLSEWIQSTFDEEYIAVIEGRVETSQALLEEKWDYIFFTGNVAVSRIVMQAAAKRMAWGKFTNSGQTCVAPDYLLIHSKVKDEFIRLFQRYITEFYGGKQL